MTIISAGHVRTVLAVLIGLFIGGSVIAAAASAASAQQPAQRSTKSVVLTAPPSSSRLGQVRVIVHGLSVQAPRHSAARGKVKAALYTHYLLQTRAKERASIGFNDGTLLQLNQRTDVVLQTSHITTLKSGEIDESDRPGSDHRIVTASATASAVGTNFDVRVVKKRSTIIVAFGTVTVANKKGSVTVGRNQETSVSPNQPPTPPQTVDAGSAIAWTGPLSGWQVLGRPFASPDAVAADAQGNVYVADTQNHRIVKLDRNGKQLLTWNHWGGGAGPMEGPTGIVVDGNGNVYASVGHNVIDKYTADGQFLAEFGKLDDPGSGPGEFFSPGGLAVDSAGNVYVADSGNSRIQKLSPTGEVLGVFDDSAGVGITETNSVAVDRDGNIYAANTIFDHIVKMAPDGTELAVFGTKGKQPGQVDGPLGLAVDNAGNIFVSDTFNARIQELSPTGDPLAVWGSGNTQDTSPGQFFLPWELSLDAHGTLYVADSGNHRIQRLVGAGQ